MNNYFRIKIKGWTASFRYPIFIYGYQPTLPIPPYSTIYGLVSAACGKWITPSDIDIKYVFLSDAVGVDLETIYEWRKGEITKTNVIKREFLLNPEIYLYIKEEEIINYFKRPIFPLLLGRSSELAFVDEIKRIDLVQKESFKVGGIILPFPPIWNLNGTIQALPTYFTNTCPRQPLGTRSWFLVKKFQNYNGKGWIDEEKGWGVILKEEKK